MKKRLFKTALTALFVIVGYSQPITLAAPTEHGGAHQDFSAEDRAAFTDAHIAALKAGLKLTPAQEKNWPAVDAALRDVAKARASRMAEWHEKAKEHGERPEVIESLHQGARALMARAGEMDKIADAAKPLYESLDDAQKRRFGMLLRAISRSHGHMGYMGHMMEHTGARPDNQEGGEHND